MRDSAAVADRIAAILPARWSDERVSDFVEFLYARATSNVRELASYAKKRMDNPYRAKVGEVINDVPHGGRIHCGAHPSLYARHVSALEVQVDPKTGLEVVSWREPDHMKWTTDHRGFEVAQEGATVKHSRQITGPLSDEEIWDRTTQTWKKGFKKPDP